MKKTTRRVLALALAVVMVFALAACTKTPGGTGGTGNGPGPDGKLFDNNVELSIVVGSHASYPYDANWKLWQYFKEAVGGNLKVSAISGSEFDTKVNLMMTSPDTLPDLLHLSNKNLVNSHSASGAFVAMDDNLDKMPNYSAFINSLEGKEREELLAQRTSGDGKIYFPPAYGSQTVMNLRSWMYRKDIFEKNGLKAPETLDDLYNVCKQLKKLYPNSYPLCFRNGIGQIDIMGPMFKNNFASGLYYDFKAQKWCFGAQEDTMKEIIQFFLKMYDEGLVPPDYTTITTGSWEELVSTGRAFIMPEYVIRVAYFNVPNQVDNPEYEWAFMQPPAGTNGVRKVAKTNLDMTGYVVCNTGRTENINNALRLVDWMYTDDACELLSWGKEGETYKMQDGKKAFILGEGETPQLKYGFGTYGLYQRVEPAAFEEIFSQGNPIDPKTYEYTEENANPTLWLPLNEDETARYTELFDAINTYSTEMLSKFLLKQKSLSEWDTFQKTLTQMGVEDLKAIYEGAWKRVMG